MGGGWPTPHPGRLTPRKDLVPIVYQAGWPPEAGLDTQKWHKYKKNRDIKQGNKDNTATSVIIIIIIIKSMQYAP